MIAKLFVDQSTIQKCKRHVRFEFDGLGIVRARLPKLLQIEVYVASIIVRDTIAFRLRSTP
jgi:hypothetical protein